MAAKLDSFRHSINEKQERLLSSNGFPDFRFTDIELNDLESDNYRRRRLGCCCSSGNLSGKLSKVYGDAKVVARKAWDMGVSDPRKIVFSAKIGLALTIVAVLIFYQKPNPDLSRYSVWAILTVVVVFEFTIGATLSKGFNRALGTLSAGGLALGMAELSTLFGDLEELFCTVNIFCIELQRVGVEEAKLLRELGEKVKKMEKLGSDDILFEVHLAAEELQHKIDKKSYLLVKSEYWEIGNRATKQSQLEPQEELSLGDSEPPENHEVPIYTFKSLSEAVLEIPTRWGEKNQREPLNHRPTFSKQVSWPARLVLPPHLEGTNGASPLVDKTETYESASALSLATFASLLIEFVARLHNVVHSFEELSEIANFKEPEVVIAATNVEFSEERVALGRKIRRCFGM